MLYCSQLPIGVLLFAVLFRVFPLFRLLVPSTDRIRAMSSAHAEMVLHEAEDREKQNSDNDTYRLFRHVFTFLLPA